MKWKRNSMAPKPTKKDIIKNTNKNDKFNMLLQKAQSVQQKELVTKQLKTQKVRHSKRVSLPYMGSLREEAIDDEFKDWDHDTIKKNFMKASVDLDKTLSNNDRNINPTNNINGKHTPIKSDSNVNDNIGNISLNINNNSNNINIKLNDDIPINNDYSDLYTNDKNINAKNKKNGCCYWMFCCCLCCCCN